MLECWRGFLKNAYVQILDKRYFLRFFCGWLGGGSIYLKIFLSLLLTRNEINGLDCLSNISGPCVVNCISSGVGASVCAKFMCLVLGV